MTPHRHLAIALLAVFLSACSQQAGTPTTTTPVEPEPTASSTKPRPPADPQVLAAQKALAQLGYYRGSIDGIAGPKTRRAVADYQSDLGLTPDGSVTRDLVARLAETPSAPSAQRPGDPAKGPLYETGDVYIYSDGSVETVVSADPHGVEWQNAAGSRWVAPPDFTLPAGQSDNAMVQQPLSWPLAIGAISKYSVKSDPGPIDPWRCAVEGREKISVAAGVFDTYAIVCRPDDGSPGTGQSRAWYYAPALRHYVRYVDSAASSSNDVTQTRSRDLVAISPGAIGWPSEARVGFAWAISHALESEPEGDRIPWESTAIADRFVIVPGPSIGAGSSHHCRRLIEERIESDGATRLFPGVACRTGEGQWHLLGLDGNPVSIVASAVQ
jgi:peptidoglycan hydrolase-like protein with peptidoglycan-binding domain